MNLGNGGFVEGATAYGVDSLGDGRGMAIADFDRDGDVDMIITNYKSKAQYYVNKVARGCWLQIRLRGRQNNRDGVGAIIRIRSGDNQQMRIISAGDGYASQFSRVAHFGVGESEIIEELEVSWPNGKRQIFEGVPANQMIEIDENRATIQLVRRREAASRPISY